MKLLGSFKPQSKMAAEHKIDDEQLAAIARKIATMPWQEIATAPFVSRGSAWSSEITAMDGGLARSRARPHMSPTGLMGPSGQIV